ncbi:hypothetical protein DFA_04109 [Cavenderia fasciculata]|uniref:Uncharacterized protein n=1 Tax=Cavenderia fasciculata TaxID=261658 RepID=F4Q1B3_CACFS|nr:uncharacterized protein DFA_04109 [Cavenderia fasciculata]EGG18614.1 hypothetical protein DFA_04109 [Cavenderia fasciculata]|eukprot:XP_004366518.1 hypothetical protein DFA_04109 [Cavenderia fasciculata]
MKSSSSIIIRLLFLFIFIFGQICSINGMDDGWWSSSSEGPQCAEDCTVPPSSWVPSAPCMQWGCNGTTGQCGQVSMCPTILGCYDAECTMEGCRYNVSTCYSCENQMMTDGGDCYERLCNTTDVLVINKCASPDPCQYSSCNEATKKCQLSVPLCQPSTTDHCTLHQCDATQRKCTQKENTCDQQNQSNLNSNCTQFKCINEEGGCVESDIEPFPEHCVASVPTKPLGPGVVAGIVIGAVALVAVAGVAVFKAVNSVSQAQSISNTKMNGANNNPLFQPNPAGANPLYTEP